MGAAISNQEVQIFGLTQDTKYCIMKDLRHYINLVENADTFVYHGGSYAGGDYNPHMHGEPGSLRPLGKGLYAAATSGHAQLYVKYAGDSGKVTKFKVDPNAVIYPWGALSWRALSPDDQTEWRAKSAEIQKAFEQAGLVKLDRFRNKYHHWQDAVLNNSTDQMRQILVSAGVDGARQDLGDGMVEYVFYNTKVLTPAS